MKFNLQIKLGNATMQDGPDIAAALLKVSHVIGCFDDGVSLAALAASGTAVLIKDENGNTVGEWKVVDE